MFNIETGVAAKALKQRKYILVAVKLELCYFPNSYIEALTTPPHMSECDCVWEEDF